MTKKKKMDEAIYVNGVKYEETLEDRIKDMMSLEDCKAADVIAVVNQHIADKADSMPILTGVDSHELKTAAKQLEACKAHWR